MRVLGVDVGGTFADFYMVSAEGAIAVYKRPSTPADPGSAIILGISEMDASPDEIVHGTTVATNAIIERKGARTALITTVGFRDVLAIGRQARPRLYDLAPRLEPPLVPASLRFEVAERLDYRGIVLTELNDAEVEAVLDKVQRAGAESLAVCLLFSFVNPAHERRIARAARRRGIPVSASHEVLPEHREYERTSTTVANAYVAPVMARYLSTLEQEATTLGASRLRIMSSSGGAMSATAAGRLAIRTAVSGPAAGVAGAFAVAGAAGHRSIITLDMGGTSTDVALCPGDVPFRDETRVGAFPVRGPTVDVLSVGAGGGSIARIDAGGALRVGPESAGADPGPSCYGRGEDPTVTDAHVVLGRIVPREFLGGRMRLYPDRARKAISRLGGGADAAAAAVLRVATANMERAVRAVSVERGYDPRMFTLVAFGGAGPLHACDVAESLRIKRIIVPAYPGVLSALGMARAPVVKDLSAALAVSLGPGDRGLLQARRAVLKTAERLEATGRRELAREGFPLERLSARRILEMRYAGQSYELPVDADSDNPRRWAQSFHQSHEARFNHSDTSRQVEIMGARVRLALPPSAGECPPAALAPRRRSAPLPRAEQLACLQGDFLVAAVYSREDIAAGSRLAGPAIVVQMDSTTVINPGWGARADGWGNLVLERR